MAQQHGLDKRQHNKQKKKPQKSGLDIKLLPDWTPDWAKSRLLTQMTLLDVLPLCEATKFLLFPDLARIVASYVVLDTEHVLRCASVLDPQGRVVEWPMGKKKKLRLYVQEYLTSKLELGRIYSQEEVMVTMTNWMVKGPKCVVDMVQLRRDMYSDTGLLGKNSDGPTYWRLNLRDSSMLAPSGASESSLLRSLTADRIRGKMY